MNTKLDWCEGVTQNVKTWHLAHFGCLHTDTVPGGTMSVISDSKGGKLSTGVKYGGRGGINVW